MVLEPPCADGYGDWNMIDTPDPRLSLPLKKPAKLRDTVMALTFVPDAREAKVVQANIKIEHKVVEDMITRLRTGKVRLQIVNGFGTRREIVLEDGAEALFLYSLLERFITELPK